MNREGLHSLLQELGAIKIKDEGEWVMACCLFSPYVSEHNNRQEQNPSFGLSVHDNDLSKYNCFTCGSKGTVVQLLEAMQRFQGEDYGLMIEELTVTELLGPPQGKWKEKGKIVRKEIVRPLGDEYADLYGPCQADHPYLKSRGVGQNTCKRLQLKHDPSDSKGKERILFPVWNHKGEFFGYTGRAVDSEVEPRIRDYYGLPKRAMLLGIHQHHRADYVCLSEGLFDYAKGQAMGFPVVAVMHSGLTEAQADILKEIGKPVYGFYDNDEAGKSGNLSAAEQLIDHVPYMAVRWPKGVKDVGDLNKREMQKMIDKAQLYRIPNRVLQ